MNLDELLKNFRVDYTPQRTFDETTLAPDPITQLQQWLTEAYDEHVPELNAMVLSTCNTLGDISSRVVLLKEVTQQGLIFHSNYQSHKAHDIQAHDKVALNFFWQPMSRQVRIEGTAKKVSAEQSDAYFLTRPRKSQIAAWASMQSQVIAKRDELEQNVERIANSYPHEQAIPRPDFWGGYCIMPTYFEFWQGNRNRLHDRICYQRNHLNQWQTNRLAP